MRWLVIALLLLGCASSEGTPVARAKAWRTPRGNGVLVLICGQSNAFGFGGANPLMPFWTTATAYNALQSHYLKDADSVSGQVYADSGDTPIAIAPVNTFYPVGSGTPVRHVSPGLAAVHALAVKGLESHVVQVAQGGTEIAKFQPGYSPPTGENNFNVLVSRARFALSYLRSSRGFVPETIFLHMDQGEQDCNFNTPGNTYRSGLLAFYEAIDAAFPEFEIRYAHRGLNWRSGNAFVTEPDTPTIRQAQIDAVGDFVAAGAHAIWGNTDDCNIRQIEGLHWKDWFNLAHIVQEINALYPEYPHVIARTLTSSSSYWRDLTGGFSGNDLFEGSATMSLVYTVRKTTSGASFTDEHQLHDRYSANVRGFSARLGTGSTAKLLLVDGGGVSRTASMTVDLSDQRIHQIAWTFDGTTVRGYLDGVEQSVTGSAVTGYTPASDVNLLTFVGRHTSGSTQELGIIHISASATDVLSGTEIADMWTAARTTHNHDIPEAKRTRHYTALDAGDRWTARDENPSIFSGSNPGPMLAQVSAPDIRLEAAVYP